MSYCINPQCTNPENPDTATYCHYCHSPLILQGQYRILKKVGQGSFGQTFLAVDEQHPLKLPCILKQISFPTLDPENYQTTARLFRREVMRLGQLGKHPQIPLLLAHFQYNQNLYLVQEYIQGLTLKQELQQSLFNEEKIWQLLRELLPVLEFIHQHQIIHRDIKPENIIRRNFPPINYQKPPYLPGENQLKKLGKIGELVLIDFGVAKLLTGTALIKTGTIIGSPEYMAPEQTRGKALPASDLFSLGVTCIHLLTDVAPWDMFDVINDCWRWRDFLPNGSRVSQSLGSILDKLLQNSVSQRYQTAAQALSALESPSNIVRQPVENLESLGLVNQKLPLLPSVRSLVGRFVPKIMTLDENELISAVGVEYGKLQYLLAVQKWQEADRETWGVLCDALRKRRKSYLFPYDIDNLPCEDLLTIDRLWVKYSQGKFGFSVQKQIYESVNEDYGKFCSRVGWLSYNLHFRDRGFKFRSWAAVGHLPSRIWVGGDKWWIHLEVMGKKLDKCFFV
ncbi:serine/threonine-protein kinase [Okeania sp.]|uniref:serine/threonine-protein kinase n=1 Tax=Okeania sp. TaxID=3100323 RepID=UPI002B4AEC77|nr:serine/threonine-protein kinase [Okeania sp.]MEB3343698.1 serine/threonine-protein kinase [Okeania sp.]